MSHADSSDKSSLLFPISRFEEAFMRKIMSANKVKPSDRTLRRIRKRNNPTVAQRRNYAVVGVEAAKQIAKLWLLRAMLLAMIELGLPEIDDRYHVWRVPLLSKTKRHRIGEVVIDARTSLILENKSTSTTVLEARLLGREATTKQTQRSHAPIEYALSALRNTIALGDCEEILQDLPADSVDLVFTSPPYYNARPEYTDYITYEEYLLKLRKVIQNSKRVLREGRFFILNVAPVLIRRINRSAASQRIAVPFDCHRLFIEEGFEFIDDIIWVKPEGAGWATGRGRRFAADRNPLQYKAVPVTEYVLVYRKKTDKLIDWFIRKHPDREVVRQSKIHDDYERTNIWKIHPAHDKKHPAIFPVELAEKIIRYYSFKKDVVLDPFAGIGTVGQAAAKLGRRFVLIDNNKEYVNLIRERAEQWLGRDASDVICINCPSLSSNECLI